MKRITKIFIIASFIFLCLPVWSSSITLSSDSDTVSVDETLRMVLTAEGSFEEITEPDFNGFSVENRSESQSNSVSIINGKMESKKSISYTYFLRAAKNGVFKIGPAKISLKNGQFEKSNTLTITVTGGGSAGGTVSGNVSADDSQSSGSTLSSSLVSPLTKWERKTPNYFLRAVVEPQGDVYEGEPSTIKYYIFVKPGSISDLNMYKSPSFENCWKEEKQESRLTFQRIAIDGEAYDYGLLKTFVIIPEKGLKSLNGTQMIVDVMTGSFFNTKKMSISTPAMRIPLIPLPEAVQHSEGIYGDFQVEVNKNSVTIDKNNLLETVEYTIKGCGNFQAAEIKPVENRELKIFAPEVDNRISTFSKGYCGEKRYKFMLKGLQTGETVLKAKPFEVFSKDKGWVSVIVPDINVNVKDVTVSDDTAGEKKQQSFELLKELPADMKIYSTKSIVARSWFLTAMAIPFLISLISFLIWFTGIAIRRRSRSFNSKLEKWEKSVMLSNDSTELLNVFYDALKDLYSIEIRGARSQALLKKHGNSFADITEFIREIEYLTFSGTNVNNLNALKEKASGLLRLRGRKK
ncbi:MAG TPA: BatD family protein [bacterium]|nr:BatD family protein [bacterium]HPS29226.1 BatD family protein [bacterium]